MVKEKLLIFDAGSLISLAMSGLLPKIEQLKKKFNGEFVITPEVKKEIIDKPLGIKKYELEGMQIQQLLNEEIIKLQSEIIKKFNIDKKKLSKEKNKIMNIANETFYSKGKTIDIIQEGEASCLALSRFLSQKKIENAIAVDERTTRVLVEKPDNLKKLFHKKLHTRIKSNKQNYEYFKKQRFNVIRSSEIVYIMFKKGLFSFKEEKKKVLDALLYSVKFRGCAISGDEIKKIKSLL